MPYYNLQARINIFKKAIWEGRERIISDFYNAKISLYILSHSITPITRLVVYLFVYFSNYFTLFREKEFNIPV